MTKTKQEILDDIKAHISEEGSGYSSWYVGISKDAKDRLFNEHDVKEEGDWWICCEASSSSAAREIEDYLVNALGTDGGVGGGDEDSDQVYAYRKESHTNP